MDNIEIKSLQAVSPTELHRAWVAAFSDYQVKIEVTPEILQQNLRQNDVSLDVSVGAFAGEKLIGFWLNGLRQIDGVTTAYDAGTAIQIEYRGRGISSRLAEHSYELLGQLKAKQYVLEVLSENSKAYNIYLKNGFVVVRQFVCFQTDTPTFDALPAALGVELLTPPLTADIAGQLPAMEYKASWQNELCAMLNVKETVKMVTAKSEGQIVGYGLIQPGRGRISQLGFCPKTWSTDIPSHVLQRLTQLNDQKETSVINVEKEIPLTTALLEKHGFKNFVEQFEMVKALH